MYTDKDKTQIVDKVCELIENGQSLRSACKEISLSRKTFYTFIDGEEMENVHRRNQYARACEERADAIVDEMLEIADEKNADCYLDDEGNTVIDGNAIQRSRLMVDTRKWLASKLKPKKYGEKIDVEQSGEITISFKD